MDLWRVGVFNKGSMKSVYYGRVPRVVYSVSALYSTLHSVEYYIEYCILESALGAILYRRKQRTEAEDGKWKTRSGSRTGTWEHAGGDIMRRWVMPGHKMNLEGIGLI